MVENLEQLRTAVQRNCDVSDALFAGNYTLCIYLLKMREYFRWHQGYALTDALSGDAVGEWVEHREQLWESLACEDYGCLPLNADCYDPFDNESINRALIPQGFVYSGGYGGFGKPHFFLGQLLSAEPRDDLMVYVSSCEYARDLTAPPAMIQGKQVFVRRESLRRSIWELIEEWQWTRHEGPMRRAVKDYAFERDPQAALERITDDQVTTVVFHEMGEAMVAQRFGEAWEQMLVTVAGSPAELIARAVRDHLADCLVTLPRLLDKGQAPPVHFYFAGLRGMRRQLFPEAVAAYEQWVSKRTLSPLQAVLRQGSERFGALSELMLELRQEDAAQLARAIEDLVALPQCK
ncbi:MAG: Sfum_1244 family protein [Gammaproteobacteria bacterium]|jgi:hypothetical protein